MVSHLRLSSVIPAGLIVESAAEEAGVIDVSARAGATWGACPVCGRAASRVLTRYLPLYFPEADRFHRSSRSDWSLTFLEAFPSIHILSTHLAGLWR